MVEWGNYWAKAIKLRDYQHTEAYMGLFSQIGELYNVKVIDLNALWLCTATDYWSLHLLKWLLLFSWGILLEKDRVFMFIQPVLQIMPRVRAFHAATSYVPVHSPAVAWTQTWWVHVLSLKHDRHIHIYSLWQHCLIFVLGYKKLKRQITQLTLDNPQHVWCYESLEARQAAREVVWQATQEQWQEIVARTVPLIRWLFVDILTKNKTISTIWFYRRMSSRVLVPLPISTTKWTRAKMTHDNLLLFRSLNKCYWIRGDCLYHSPSISM